MANALYWPWKHGAMSQTGATYKLNGGTNPTNPFVIMTTSGYSVNLTSHNVLSDVTGAAIVGGATGKEMTNPTVGTVAVGVFDADNVSFTAVAAGSTILFLVFYINANAVAGNSRLFLYEDTVSGIPGPGLATNGGNIDISFATGGIFIL